MTEADFAYGKLNKALDCVGVTYVTIRWIEVLESDASTECKITDVGGLLIWKVYGVYTPIVSRGYMFHRSVL